MTGFGDVTIGRLVLREALTSASEKTDDAGNATVSISGQESSTGRSKAELAAVQDDIRGLAGRLVPVTWTDKSGRNGYYMVSGPSADLMDWQGELITLAWSMSLVRVGSDSEVDLESQLSGPLTRTNGYAVTGERWQAPPVGHSSYWSGATAPSTMTRTGADGVQTIYRGVPLGVNTRYACPVENYGGGRVRVIDSLLMERTGTDFPLDPLGWEINNALTRVRWDAAGLKVASWDAGTSAWEPKTFVVTLGGVDLHMPDAVTPLRNEYEAATVRLLWTRSPVGRATVDITLRRGARVAEFYAQSLPSATVTVALEIPEPTSSATGYIVASTNDANGNRFMCGSVGTFTANTTLSSISKTSTAAMDFCIGMVVGGSSAVTGDGAAVLYAQYLGAAGESVRATRR